MLLHRAPLMIAVEGHIEIIVGPDRQFVELGKPNLLSLLNESNLALSRILYKHTGQRLPTERAVKPDRSAVNYLSIEQFTVVADLSVNRANGLGEASLIHIDGNLLKGLDSLFNSIQLANNA